MIREWENLCGVTGLSMSEGSRSGNYAYRSMVHVVGGIHWWLGARDY